MALDGKRSSGRRPVPGRRGVVPGSGRVQRQPVPEPEPEVEQEPEPEPEPEHELPLRLLGGCGHNRSSGIDSQKAPAGYESAARRRGRPRRAGCDCFWRLDDALVSNRGTQEPAGCSNGPVLEKRTSTWEREEFDKANAAGLKFVLGLKTKADDDKSLFAPFQNDDKDLQRDFTTGNTKPQEGRGQGRLPAAFSPNRRNIPFTFTVRGHG